MAQFDQAAVLLQQQRIRARAATPSSSQTTSTAPTYGAQQSSTYYGTAIGVQARAAAAYERISKKYAGTPRGEQALKSKLAAEQEVQRLQAEAAFYGVGYRVPQNYNSGNRVSSTTNTQNASVDTSVQNPNAIASTFTSTGEPGVIVIDQKASREATNLANSQGFRSFVAKTQPASVTNPIVATATGAPIQNYSKAGPTDLVDRNTPYSSANYYGYSTNKGENYIISYPAPTYAPPSPTLRAAQLKRDIRENTARAAQLKSSWSANPLTVAQNKLSLVSTRAKIFGEQTELLNIQSGLWYERSLPAYEAARSQPPPTTILGTIRVGGERAKTRVVTGTARLATSVTGAPIGAARALSSGALLLPAAFGAGFGLFEQGTARLATSPKLIVRTFGAGLGKAGNVLGVAAGTIYVGSKLGEYKSIEGRTPAERAIRQSQFLGGVGAEIVTFGVAQQTVKAALPSTAFETTGPLNRVYVRNERIQTYATEGVRTSPPSIAEALLGSKVTFTRVAGTKDLLGADFGGVKTSVIGTERFPLAERSVTTLSYKEGLKGTFFRETPVNTRVRIGKTGTVWSEQTFEGGKIVSTQAPGATQSKVLVTRNGVTKAYVGGGLISSGNAGFSLLAVRNQRGASATLGEGVLAQQGVKNVEYGLMGMRGWEGRLEGTSVVRTLSRNEPTRFYSLQSEVGLRGLETRGRFLGAKSEELQVGSLKKALKQDRIVTRNARPTPRVDLLGNEMVVTPRTKTLVAIRGRVFTIGQETTIVRGYLYRSKAQRLPTLFPERKSVPEKRIEDYSWLKKQVRRPRKLRVLPGVTSDTNVFNTRDFTSLGRDLRAIENVQRNPESPPFEVIETPLGSRGGRVSQRVEASLATERVFAKNELRTRIERLEPVTREQLRAPELRSLTRTRAVTRTAFSYARAQRVVQSQQQVRALVNQQVTPRTTTRTITRTVQAQTTIPRLVTETAQVTTQVQVPRIQVPTILVPPPPSPPRTPPPTGGGVFGGFALAGGGGFGGRGGARRGFGRSRTLFEVAFGLGGSRALKSPGGYTGAELTRSYSPRKRGGSRKTKKKRR